MESIKITWKSTKDFDKLKKNSDFLVSGKVGLRDEWCISQTSDREK